MWTMPFCDCVVPSSLAAIFGSKTKAFQAAVRAQAKKLAVLGYELTLTGPWPPYNFVVDRQ